MTSLATIEVQSQVPATAAIIWMHGLGAQAQDFLDFPAQLGLAHAPIHWVMPQAPLRGVTIHGGMLAPAWYDIRSLSDLSQEDQEGLRATAQQIEGLMKSQAALGIPYERMVLGGFSQGGAQALYTALQGARPLAGVVACSSYLPMAKQYLVPGGEPPVQPPVFMAHGTEDPTVPLFLGQYGAAFLSRLGCQVAWHAYPMAHTMVDEQMLDLRRWLCQCLQLSG